MNKRLRPYLRLVIVASILLLSQAAAAQDPYTFTASALGGLGGALDVEPDPGFGNPALQLGFSWETEINTQVGFRLGHLDFGGERLGSRADGGLTYLTVAGEYRFKETYYESGLFLGLGGYRLEGGALSREETALGLVAGVTGEFSVTRQWAILVELSAHYADLDEVQLFGIAHGGVAFRF